MNKNYLIIYVVFLVLILGSCRDEVYYNSFQSGELKGTAYSYYNSTSEGIKVTAEGSIPLKTSVTDANGNYSIKDLESGTYNLVFEKEGYFPYKVIGYPFVGGDLPISLPPVYLYQKPTLQINNLNIKLENYESYYYSWIKINFSADVTEKAYSLFRLYLSNEPNVSFTNYLTTEIVSTYSFPSESIINADTLKYPTGSQLYVIAYPADYSSQYYLDLQTGKKIYTNVCTDNPSNVANIIVPTKKEY